MTYAHACLFDLTGAGYQAASFGCGEFLVLDFFESHGHSLCVLRGSIVPQNLRAAAGLLTVLFFLWAYRCAAQAQAGQNQVVIERVEGLAEVVVGNPPNVINATNGLGLSLPCVIRTREQTRILFKVGASTVVRGGGDTEVEFSSATNGVLAARLNRGRLYFLHRDQPGRFTIETPAALATVRGTDFGIVVAANGTTTYDLFDGQLEVANQIGSPVKLRGRDAAVAEPNQAPHRTPVIEMSRVVQWNLYYPAIIDLDELGLDAGTNVALIASLAAYRTGDLLGALKAYPEKREPASRAESLYLVGLLLAVGEVDKSRQQIEAGRSLAGTAADVRLDSITRALLRMITTVTGEKPPEIARPESSAEWLAASLEKQSQGKLAGALDDALAAVRAQPESGFANARVAELQFSFGDAKAAARSLATALACTPNNAAAVALSGFTFAARGNYARASDQFDLATRLDPGLGNGWLGRGLCRIHAGDRNGGLNDLQIAATVEPTRALLRSYLAKAYAEANDVAHATNEFTLAKELDPNDPTAWLYSALFLQKQNRFNEGIASLEKSMELNTNRAVYRSQLRLDEDRAVRGASLASIYRDAGMDEVSLREASRAVSADYGNYSAHLFLANSYDALRDPTRFNLRNETIWFNELLLANMLSPVGAGTFSQNISQQEYTRMFEQNRLGLSSTTEYRSDGQVRQTTSQYGTVDKFGYALDVDYQHNSGVRPNNELDRLEWYSTFKYQLSPQDTLLLLTKYQDYHSGDNFQYYDPTNARPDFAYDEHQSPIVVGGYHHEWSPGVHTLFLAGRLENKARLGDIRVRERIVNTDTNGTVASTSNPRLFDVNYQSELEAYTAELSQIFDNEHGVLVVGGRMQFGEFQTSDLLTISAGVPPGQAALFTNPPSAASLGESFDRATGYAYYTLKVIDDLLLTAGFSYDRIEYPSNHRSPPISAGTETRDQLSPKAAVVWNLRPELTLRGMYARALGGVSLDESFRLEPAQLAGFAQSYRTIISESEVGSVSAPAFDIGGLALDLKLRTRSYLGIQANWLQSDVASDVGSFNRILGVLPPPLILPSTTRQHLGYTERSVSVTFNQLVSDVWSFGAQYRYTLSDLDTIYPALRVSGTPIADTHVSSDLHQSTLFALFNHPSGFFFRAEAQWFHQQNSGYSPQRPGADFFQGNIFLGWRLKRQQAEIGAGVLNVGGGDYRLSPLTPYAELPRERVFVTQLKINL